MEACFASSRHLCSVCSFEGFIWTRVKFQEKGGDGEIFIRGNVVSRCHLMRGIYGFLHIHCIYIGDFCLQRVGLWRITGM